MDFAVVVGGIVDILPSGILVVRSDGSGVPVVSQRADVYTLSDMLEGIPFPTEVIQVRLMNVLANPAAVRTSVMLPLGFIPIVGAHSLLGSLNLKHDTQFFRFTSTPVDLRFNSSALKADTYLTTENDRHFVNSGFGAVGRYALPMPIPASFVHNYTLPAGTHLMVGTVGPQFGQAGGGVEVKTVGSVSGVVLNSTLQIDDC